MGVTGKGDAATLPGPESAGVAGALPVIVVAACCWAWPTGAVGRESEAEETGVACSADGVGGGVVEAVGGWDGGGALTVDIGVGATAAAAPVEVRGVGRCRPLDIGADAGVVGVAVAVGTAGVVGVGAGAADGVGAGAGVVAAVSEGFLGGNDEVRPRLLTSSGGRSGSACHPA